MAMYPAGALVFGIACCGLTLAHIKASVQHCQIGWMYYAANAQVKPPPPLTLRDNYGLQVTTRNFAAESQENAFITDQVGRAAKGGPKFSAAEYKATKLAFAEAKRSAELAGVKN